MTPTRPAASDLAFDHELRALLAGDAPEAVPASLRAFVAGLPVRAADPRPVRLARPRIAWATLAAAAVLLVVVAGIAGGAIRLPGFLGTIGGPTGTSAAPSDGRHIHLRVVADGGTPSAQEVDAVVAVLRARLDRFGLGDSGVTVGGADIVVQVNDGATASAPAAMASLRTLLVTRGRIDVVPLGNDALGAGQRVDLAAHPPLFSGDQVTDAKIGEDQTGQRTLDLTLAPAAARALADLTATHVGEYLAIAQDGIAITVPVIQSTIPDGKVQITAGEVGSFTTDEANRLVAILASGPLPLAVVEVADEPPATTPTPTLPAATAPPGVQPLTLAFVPVVAAGAEPTREELDAIGAVLEARLGASGLQTFTRINAGARDRLTYQLPVDSTDEAAHDAYARLLEARGVVEMVTLGTIGLEGGLVGPDTPRLFAGLHRPIAHASLVTDRDSGLSTLDLTLSDEAAAILATWSRAHTGELVALVVDGQAVEVTTILEPILEGGMSMGMTGGPEVIRRIAAIVEGGELPMAIREVAPTGTVDPGTTPLPVPSPTPDAELRLEYRIEDERPTLPEDLLARVDAVVGGRVAVAGVSSHQVSRGTGGRFTVTLPIAPTASTVPEIVSVMGATGAVTFLEATPGSVNGAPGPGIFGADLDPVESASVVHGLHGVRTIQVNLTAAATAAFATWTRDHPGSGVDLVLDGTVVGSLTVGEPVLGGVVEFAKGGDGYGEAEADDLAIIMNAGRYPEPITLVSSNIPTTP